MLVRSLGSWISLFNSAIELQQMKRTADHTKAPSRKKLKIGGAAIVSETNLFDLLPDEILREILSYLNDHDLRWTRLVDYRLFNLIDIRHFNVGVVLASEMSEVTRVFGRYDKPIGLTFRKPHMLGVDSIAQLTQLTQLVSLDIGQHIKLDQKLTNLHSLAASVSLTDLQRHTRLTSLVTSRADAESGQVFPSQQRLQVEAIVMSQQVTCHWGGFAETVSKLDPDRHEKCFKGMPNIKHLDLKVPTNPELLPGIECHLTGLESLSTTVAITDLPVHTMTGLTVMTNPKSGNVNWDIVHLTNLRRLNINDKQFLAHNSLLPFKLLESLTVQGPSVDEYLTQLISTNITELDVMIKSSSVSDHVAAFCNLQRLCLRFDTEIKLDLARWSHLVHLTSLVLGSASGVLKELTNMSAYTNFTNLMELSVIMKQQGGSDEVIDLRTLTRLTQLVFKGATPPIDISNVTNLLSLEFYQTRIPIGLSLLHNLTSLCSLGLRGHEISSLTSLQELGFGWGHQFSDDELMALSNLTRLTSLRARTSGSGKHLTRLTRLQKLDLLASQGTEEIHNNLQAKFIYCEHPLVIIPKKTA